VKREANTTAHALAKLAVNALTDVIWMEEIPVEFMILLF
jgi:hypothetical protein